MSDHAHSPAHGQDHPHRPGTTVHLELDAENNIVILEVNGLKHDVSPRTENPGHEACHIEVTTSSRDSPDSASAHQQGKRLLMAQTRNGIATIAILIGLEILIEFLWFRNDPTLLEEFGWWIFYLDVTVVSLVIMIGYLRSYRYASTNHMISMMIGMTVGMQVGMMTGGVIGATDGYFMGALVGVGLGTALGVGTAWCCGPMAITQALMSAVMGGTMGSMIVAMMPPEKLLVFMPIFTFLNIAILVWFSFLFFKDCVVGERCRVSNIVPFWKTFLISALAVGGLGGLMVITPGHSEHFKSSDDDKPEASSNPFETREIDKATKPASAPGEMKCGAGMACGAKMKR